MTDAAMPVTEQALERFAEGYLRSLGAEIEKRDRQWKVKLPDQADTALELDDVVLRIASDPDEVDDDQLALAPESPLVERMLDEAADRTPYGSISLTHEDWEIGPPAWVMSGPTEVASQTFTPYYDRKALCVLFHVGIETVSEYQREELRAVALDLNDDQDRPRLAETYLELSETDRYQTLPEGTTTDERTLQRAIDSTQSIIREEIASLVQNTQEQATRAAEVELDEYRQLVRQRRDELQKEIERMDNRIEELNETIDGASNQAERVDALRKRKDLRSELEEYQSELDDYTSQIQSDFSEKRRDVWDRHSITVRIRPTTATTIAYERGELELRLEEGDSSVSVSYPYAVGIGIMDTPTCDRCGAELTESNPVTIRKGQMIGSICCDD